MANPEDSPSNSNQEIFDSSFDLFPLNEGLFRDFNGIQNDNAYLMPIDQLGNQTQEESNILGINVLRLDSISEPTINLPEEAVEYYNKIKEEKRMKKRGKRSRKSFPNMEKDRNKNLLPTMKKSISEIEIVKSAYNSQAISKFMMSAPKAARSQFTDLFLQPEAREVLAAVFRSHKLERELLLRRVTPENRMNFIKKVRVLKKGLLAGNLTNLS